MILILKLTLAPLFIGLASLAGRVWGNGVAGWLAALPIIAGPIVFILTLEHGLEFGESAASSTILGILLLVAFCLSYAHISRYANCIITLFLSWLITFLLIWVLKGLTIAPAISFLIVIAALFSVLKLLPKYDSNHHKKSSPRWEIILRMIAVAALVMAITSLAQFLGPSLSGLLAPFPVASSVLAVFTHRFSGVDAAISVTHGFVSGLFSYTLFFFVLATTLQAMGILLSFIFATVLALAAHAFSGRYLKGFTVK